jgi:hypothetical protein
MEPAVFRLPAGVDAPLVSGAVNASWDGSLLRRDRALLVMHARLEEELLLARAWRWPWRWRGDDALERDVVRALVGLGATAINDVASEFRG